MPIILEIQLMLLIVMLRHTFNVHLLNLLASIIPQILVLQMLHLPFQPFRIFVHNDLVYLGEPVLKCLGSILYLELLIVQENASPLLGVLLVV